MRAVLLLLALLVLIALPALAGQFEDMTAEGHGFAAGQKGYLNGLAGGSDARAAEYGGTTAVTADLHPCNQVNAQGQKTCGGEQIVPGEDPSQFYGMSPSQLEDNARVRAASDSNAQYLFDAHNERPKFDVTREDPLFTNMDANESSMVNLSDSYTGCKEIVYGGVSDGGGTTDTCKKTGTPTYRELTCDRRWTGVCHWLPAAPFSLGSGSMTPMSGKNSVLFGNQTDGQLIEKNSSTPWTHYNVVLPSDVEFTLHINKSALDPETRFHIVFVHWVADVDWKPAYRPRLIINGSEVTGSWTYWGIAKKTYRFVATFSSLRNYLIEGDNKVTVITNGASVEVESLLNLHNGQVCEQGFTDSLTCANDQQPVGMFLFSASCADSSNPKVFEGVNFQRACWQESETYREESIPQYAEEPYCQALRDKGCHVAATDCNVTSPAGWCADATLKMSCPAASAPQTVQVCGDTLVCPGGNCYDQYKTTEDSTPDFLQAASYLAAMQDMKSQFDPAAASVWKGEYKSCTVNVTLIGSDQCCTGGSGTINTLGKTCNTTETQINQARNDERTSFLGSITYCTQQVLGVCVNKERAYNYCVWPSKIARIVQDQGRPLMGQTVAPPCPGFSLQSPNEFALIDWSRIDFSGYYTDVMSKYASTPQPTANGLINQVQQSGAAMQTEYSQKMQQYYGQ